MARESSAGGAVSPPAGRLIPSARTPLDEGRPGAVLDSKVSVPAPTMPVLPRPRLFDALAAAAEHRVTIVNASAGAGKTLLLASWLSWSTRQRAAWVSFDRTDNEPKVFWSYIVEALRRACAGREGDLFGQLAEPDLAGDRFPERFLDAVGELDEPLVLVVDQAHAITDWRVLGGLETVLAHAPANLRLVLAGRGVPAVPLARLRVAGDLADIGAADLACTHDEARELFALHGLELRPAEVAGILHRTGGWMAGLRLAALWWHEQPEIRRAPATFTSEEPLVADYLADEVVDVQPSAVRTFLLRTSVVERVNGELADVLTGQTDGRQTLDALERENALVTGSGAGQAWYTYGPLLREFLLQRLHQEMPNEIPTLHRQAAQWFGRHGMVVEAGRSAVAAGDWSLAGSLLIGEGCRAFANGEGAALEPLLAQIPADEVRLSPELASVSARARLTRADPDGAEAFIRIVEGGERTATTATWSGPAGNGSGTAAGQNGHDHARLLRQIDAAELRLHQACLRGLIDPALPAAAYDLLDQARDAGLHAPESRDVGTLAYWLGVAELWRGRVVAARAAFEQALPRLADGGFRAWERRAYAWTALLNAVDGRLGAAERGLAAASRSVGDEPDPGSNGHGGQAPETARAGDGRGSGDGRGNGDMRGTRDGRGNGETRGVRDGRGPRDGRGAGEGRGAGGNGRRVAAAQHGGRVQERFGGDVPRDTDGRVPAGAEEAFSANHGVWLAYELTQALVDVERDRLDQAWNRLSSLQPRPAGDQLASASAEPPLGELLGLLRARVLTHQGDLTAAKAELAGALDAATRLRPHVEHYAGLLSVEIALHEGNGAPSKDGAGTSDGSGAPEGVAGEGSAGSVSSPGSVSSAGSAGSGGSPGRATAANAATGPAGTGVAGRAAGSGASTLTTTDPAMVAGGEPPNGSTAADCAATVYAANAVAQGRLHLAAGDPAAALEAVTPCLSSTAAETRLLDTVAALLVAATAHRRLGTQASATGYLERALTLARDDELIRVFLDAGRGVRALLTVAIPPQGPHAGFRSSLLHRFDVQPAATWRSPDQLTRLTASERAVLRYLPSHLTNEEIAQDLCLSVNTVKSHLRTLYRKLGVTCRREAIARALQLELLR